MAAICLRQYMNTQEQVEFLGIFGSLRKASFSTGILRTLARKATPSMLIDVMTLEEIPFYNEDLDRSPGLPGIAVTLSSKTSGRCAKAYSTD